MNVFDKKVIAEQTALTAALLISTADQGGLNGVPGNKKRNDQRIQN